MNRRLEVCTFNISDFKQSIKHNISRIELCANKSVGGVTPSQEDIQYAVSKDVPIYPIIRPREGNFIYNNNEIKEMINSISFCKEIGCRGIVFGILDEKNNIDISKCKDLIKESEGLSLTFHMAFDLTNDPFSSMEKIIDLGFDRILTAGQKNSAEDGIKLINNLANKSNSRISIMPGSKLRSSNINMFLDNNLISEYHSSCYINNKFSEIELKRLIRKIFN